MRSPGYVDTFKKSKLHCICSKTFQNKPLKYGNQKIPGDFQEFPRGPKISRSFQDGDNPVYTCLNSWFIVYWNLLRNFEGVIVAFRTSPVIKEDSLFLLSFCFWVQNYSKARGKQFNPFVPSAPFLYPLKTKSLGFLFLGGRETVHWERMD